MTSFDDLERRFAAISPTLRLAFLASGAERILPIYEKFWVGDFNPDLIRTVELAWQTIEGGSVDPVEVQRCFNASKEIAELYAEESISVLTEVASIAGYIMDMLKPADPAEVALAAPRGYSSVETAGQDVDGALSLNDIAAASAQAEEEAWLDAAVARAESWTGPVTRDTFRDLGSFPPKWWAVYSTVKRPY